MEESLLCESDAAGVCVVCGSPLGTNRRVCSAKQPQPPTPQPEPPEPKRSACCDRCVMSEKQNGSAVWCQPMHLQLSTTGGGCCGGDTPTRYAVTNAIHAVEFGMIPCPVKVDKN